MKKRVVLFFVITILLSTIQFANSALSDIFEKVELNIAESEYIPAQIVVKFKPGLSNHDINELVVRHGCLELYKSPLTETCVLEIPREEAVDGMLKRFREEPVVEYAQPNYVCSALWMPNDPLYSYQWNFEMINMEEAWDIASGGSPSVVVAVLDTGVAYEKYRGYKLAPDLAGTTFVPGYDFINNDAHPNDDNSHGTHVTGTIAQTTNNGIGVAGIAFNTAIMPVKVLDNSGTGTDQTLADGIIWAADHGAHVISMSLGFDPGLEPIDVPTLTAAVQYAYGKGVILVGSSGNDGVGVVSLPAAYPEVIAVGAVHSGGERAYYSQYGDALDFVAPGGDDLEDRDNNGYIDGVLQQTFDPLTKVFGYYFFFGTSMAAPHVSGVAALLIANGNADVDGDGKTSSDEIRTVLLVTARDLGEAGRDDVYGWGLIDAQAATAFVEGALERFDFGDSGSPVESGYTRVTKSTLYSESLGFGWSSTAGLNARDRGAPDNLRRDFVFSSADQTFNKDLANDNYLITVIAGDQNFMHDQIDIYAEDIPKVKDLTATAGTFQETAFYTTITDGQLNLRIHDDGGTDPNWVINTITIQPGSPPPPPTEASFDFGTPASPVEVGYTQVSTSTVYSASVGYGWSSTAGLNARDRGAPDNLRRDFVFSSTDHTFNVDLANGDYQVTITIGDQDFIHDMIDVYAENNLVINDLTAAAGTFQEVTFAATVTDGQLNLRILDDGGTDSNWVITTLTIQPGTPPPPTEASFDFGTPTSPVEVGYTQVSTSTLYTASLGYGWNSTTGLHSRDRTSPDNLRRDFVFSSTDHTFNVDLANGDYQVTITIGDQDFMHDLIDVYAEDVLVINDLTAVAGSFQEVTFTATVADGQLNLNILDDGGADSNWVLNALTIVIVPP